jgi:endonuclease/exonuclease/phosphatase family metal-dependent hydrolase
MWDRDWLRAKTDVTDLFAVGTHETADGKDAFAQRTPLHGFFAARIPTGASPDTKLGGGAEKFDFQVLGVHVKAMAEGHAQRSRSAAVLTDWMTVSAPKVDADVMFMGDWSAPPHHRCWTPSHALEATPNASVAFRGTNDPSDFSYLWLANRNDKYVSRIDLTAMSLSSMHQVAGDVATVVRWKPIEDVLAEAQNLHSNEVKAVMQELKELVSDHMPTVSRFYFP